MRCPRCQSPDSSVIDSRADESTIRRRRECLNCAARFTTYERMELIMPMVVKKDGRREAFDRAKIRAGLIRACEKTGVSIEEIDRAVERIEGLIADLHIKEIVGKRIGEFVMDTLQGVNQIAYVRFASVYREFKDVSQFVDTLKTLESRAKRSSKRSKAGSSPKADRLRKNL